MAEKLIYGPPSEKWACFVCRKCFKQRARRLVISVEGVTTAQFVKHVCPHCQGNLFLTGNKFKPPRRSDTSQWKKAELLIKAGHLFNSGDSFSLARPPASLREVPEFLEEHQRRLKENRRRNRIEAQASELRKKRNKKRRISETKRMEKEALASKG